MNIGMMWFDPDKTKTIPERITKARDYFAVKYGEQPTLCYLHPSLMPERGEDTVIAGIRIKSMHTIQPNHFWIGVEQ